MGRCYRRYERLLLDENAADFAHLQAWADLLLDDDDVADCNLRRHTLPDV